MARWSGCRRSVPDLGSGGESTPCPRPVTVTRWRGVAVTRRGPVRVAGRVAPARRTASIGGALTASSEWARGGRRGPSGRSSTGLRRSTRRAARSSTTCPSRPALGDRMRHSQRERVDNHDQHEHITQRGYLEYLTSGSVRRRAHLPARPRMPPRRTVRVVRRTGRRSRSRGGPAGRRRVGVPDPVPAMPHLGRRARDHPEHRQAAGRAARRARAQRRAPMSA